MQADALDRYGSDKGRRLDEFLLRHEIRVLNIAGPRASKEPGVGRFVGQTLQRSRLLTRGGKEAV
jgi:Circularly permutated YpsA SLOG family